MKIFGVGCPRSGTTTLSDCFAAFGFSCESFNQKLFHEALAGNPEPALAHAERFDAFDDLPWCLLYRELDERFPGSKFVLTVRRSSGTWLKSYRRHHVVEHGALLSADGSRAIYRNHEYPIWPAGVEGYLQHNAAVTDYFRERPESFLTVCWECGDGWSELAEFLGLPEPSIPFPHSNPSSTRAVAVKTALLHLRRLLRPNG
jgi:hypothetical protein